jgi:hypothetical protein
MRFLRNLALFLIAGAAVAYAGKEFTKPRAADAGAYPAHEDHPDERVTVAIDPYDTLRKAELFKVNWKANGYLPVQFIVTNYGDQAISLNGMKIQWVTANRSKIAPATAEELLRRLSRSKGSDTGVPSSLPLPGRGPHAGAGKEARNEIDAARFQASTVEPHTTQSGFLFFDVGDIPQPLAGAHMYVDGITGAGARALFYFDLPVDKYLNAAASK